MSVPSRSMTACMVGTTLPFAQDANGAEMPPGRPTGASVSRRPFNDWVAVTARCGLGGAGESQHTAGRGEREYADGQIFLHGLFPSWVSAIPNSVTNETATVRGHDGCSAES